MDEQVIEKIRRYIERTGVEYEMSTPYQMRLNEVFALCNMQDVYQAVILVFDYGRAKGERSARAVQKRKTEN